MAFLNFERIPAAFKVLILRASLLDECYEFLNKHTKRFASVIKMPEVLGQNKNIDRRHFSSVEIFPKYFLLNDTSLNWILAVYSLDTGSLVTSS